ncbi:MAG: tetratricopeptide repeat protein, partial [Candidatus Krumholzibacteria bacterium]|nr:tetratricopeptide repeat protein [Candidatus Krumholzibacteria bacterium]
MRGRLISTVAAALVAAVILLIVIGPAMAESPGKLVAKGNGSFKKGDYDRAIELYEKASVRAPESPVIAFNLGDAFYRTGEFGAAREYFGDAALKAKDLSLEAGAWYNSGNCAFREAERQVDSDMEKALELYQEAVRFYMTALEKDPQLTDAAHNLEVTRLVIKDLLDKIKKQQEMMKEQQERMKEVVDSLLSLIKRQEGAIERSSGLAGEKAGQVKGWRDRLGSLETYQKGIEKGTGGVLDKLGELFPGEQPPQVKQASSHLD